MRGVMPLHLKVGVMKNHLKRLKHSNWLPIVMPVVTFVFGLIGSQLLGAAMSPLFDTSVKALLIGIVTIGLLSATILIVVTTFAHRAEERETAWLESFGVPADLVFEQAEESKGFYLERLIEYIKQTSKGDEILIMTQHRSTLPIDDTPHVNDLRKKYCDLLIQKARDEEVAYHRIICFDNNTGDASFNADYVMPWLRDHFREMLKIRPANRDRVSIKISKRKFGADIVVIPRKVGSIVLDIYNLQTGTTSSNSTLFFHNPPNKKLIEQLHAWFKEIDGQKGTFSLEEIPLSHECVSKPRA